MPQAIIVRAKQDKKIACNNRARVYPELSNNRQSEAAENSRSGVQKAPTIQINEEGCPSMDILFIYPAESEGFEPPIRRNAYTAFRVRLFRPLRQLSSRSATTPKRESAKSATKVLLFFELSK